MKPIRISVVVNRDDTRRDVEAHSNGGPLAIHPVLLPGGRVSPNLYTITHIATGHAVTPAGVGLTIGKARAALVALEASPWDWKNPGVYTMAQFIAHIAPVRDACRIAR